MITTAQVPGRRPPVLVTAEVRGPDAARARWWWTWPPAALGGNVEGSVPGETVVTGNGVTVVGAANLPSRMPTSASQAFSRNVGRPGRRTWSPTASWPST